MQGWFRLAATCLEIWLQGASGCGLGIHTIARRSGKIIRSKVSVCVPPPPFRALSALLHGPVHLSLPVWRLRLRRGPSLPRTLSAGPALLLRTETKLPHDWTVYAKEGAAVQKPGLSLHKEEVWSPIRGGNESV